MTVSKLGQVPDVSNERKPPAPRELPLTSLSVSSVRRELAGRMPIGSDGYAHAQEPRSHARAVCTGTVTTTVTSGGYAA
jgi:hypothetical protein